MIYYDDSPLIEAEKKIIIFQPWNWFLEVQDLDVPGLCGSSTCRGKDDQGACLVHSHIAMLVLHRIILDVCQFMLGMRLGFSDVDHVFFLALALNLEIPTVMYPIESCFIWTLWKKQTNLAMIQEKRSASATTVFSGMFIFHIAVKRIYK